MRRGEIMKRLIKKAYAATKMSTVKDDYLDEGSSTWEAQERHCTRWLEGTININYIKDFPGENNEHRQWYEWKGEKFFGEYPEKKWNEFVQDIKQNGVKEAIMIFVHKNGDIKIAEGNHRIQACLQAGVTEVPVDIRFFGNSQKFVKYFDE
jgi:hypothetical protein